MKDRLLSILNIKSSESAYIFDLLRVQVFIGLAISYVNIIAFTLFLKSLSIYLLPYAYLSIAGLLFLLNIGYEQLEHKTSPIKLLKHIIFFSIFILILIWCGLYLIDQPVFIFILMVWATLFYMLNGYTYWGLVSQLFNIRESRRVFSIIGAGDIPAKLIGYISSPLILHWVGLMHLLWFSIASLLIGLWLFNRSIKRRNWDTVKQGPMHAEAVSHAASTPRRSLVHVLFKSDLIFSISILAILSYNVFTLIDYTFLSHVKIRYEDLASLAAFIAAFFAFGRLIALVFKLLITSRVIDRWGIIACLFITPVTLFIFSLIFFVLDQNSDYTLYAFGAMVLLTEVLRSTMQEPVFFILFQPLKEKLRLTGHLISKGHMLPVSFLVVGVSLIIFNKMGLDVSIILTVKIVLLNLVAWAITIFWVKKNYLYTLHQSIKKGFFSSEDAYLNDQQSIDILLNKIKNGTKSEIVYALKLLGMSRHADYGKLLHHQLLNPDKEIRLYCLSELSKIKPVDIELLQELIKTESDAEVLQQLTSIICHNDKQYLNKLAEDVSVLDYPIRKVVIIQLLNQEEFDNLFKAGNELNNLIRSPVAGERDLAISIISELRNVRFTNAIEQLINDEDSTVKRNAIVAACKLRVQSILPEILEMLNLPAKKHVALQGLLQYGDNLFNDMSSLVNGDYSSEMIQLAGKMKGSQSTDYLITCIHNYPHLRDKIVYSLWRKEFKPVDHKDIKVLHVLLDQCFVSARTKLDYYHSVMTSQNHVLVKNSLNEEIRNALETSLRISGFLYNKHEINRILELIEIGDRTRLYNAIEMLELVLPQKITKELNILFDHFIDPDDTRKRIKGQEIKSLMDKIVFTQAHDFHSFTKAICIYCSWRNKEYSFIKKLSANLDEKQDFVMRETADYVLNASM